MMEISNTGLNARKGDEGIKREQEREKGIFKNVKWKNVNFHFLSLLTKYKL